MATFFPRNCAPSYKVVHNRYKIIDEIGRGSFGLVLKGYDEATTKYVAIKLERVDDNTNGLWRPRSQLKNEDTIYKILRGGQGIAKTFFYGRHQTDMLQYNVLITELLGKDLSHYFNICNRKFSIKTTLLLADQIISLIEYVHFKGVIHRDIKPENFVMGPENTPLENRLYIIDFGLAKPYRDMSTKVHITPENQTVGLVGTARYASVNALQGKTQSRRDDLEACAYMLLYFLRGELPWQNIPGSTKQEKHEKICQVKKSLSPNELCIGLPVVFQQFLAYCKGLPFLSEPRYCDLKDSFRVEFDKLGLEKDTMYDWKYLTGGGSSASMQTQPSQSQETSSLERNGSSVEVIFEWTRAQKPLKGNDSEAFSFGTEAVEDHRGQKITNPKIVAAYLSKQSSKV
ncbi:hypothetical protein B566_EDAN012177 [Ephemera danica]|nr:hypothetical protein B566_EDAN012177 [Ephemera danica]